MCRSPLPGTSLLVGELFVLLIRICMPIHVICSVMQATSLSKVVIVPLNYECSLRIVCTLCPLFKLFAQVVRLLFCKLLYIVEQVLFTAVVNIFTITLQL